METVTFSHSASRVPWLPRSECCLNVDGEGGEWAVPSPHEDKLHRLVIDDARHVVSLRSVDCGEGGND
jgi:hypothetical protein